jgi:hypothetical protein
MSSLVNGPLFFYEQSIKYQAEAILEQYHSSLWLEPCKQSGAWMKQ